MWNPKYDTNELMKQKQTQRHRKQTYGYQRGKVVGEGWTGSLELADANYNIIYRINKQQGPTV